MSCLFSSPHLTFCQIVYIESDANPADPYSRGVAGLPERRLPYHFELPVELRPFFEYV